GRADEHPASATSFPIAGSALAWERRAGGNGFRGIAADELRHVRRCHSAAAGNRKVPAVPRTTPLAREALFSAAAAASLAAVLAWLGPPGSDLAAHAYQRAVFLQHGFAPWTNFWS